MHLQSFHHCLYKASIQSGTCSMQSLMHLSKSYNNSVQGLQKEGAPAEAATWVAIPSDMPTAPNCSLRMKERLGGSAPAASHAVVRAGCTSVGTCQAICACFQAQHQGDWQQRAHTLLRIAVAPSQGYWHQGTDILLQCILLPCLSAGAGSCSVLAAVELVAASLKSS